MKFLFFPCAKVWRDRSGRSTSLLVFLMQSSFCGSTSLVQGRNTLVLVGYLSVCLCACVSVCLCVYIRVCVLHTLGIEWDVIGLSRRG